MRYCKLFTSLVVVLFVTMLSIRAEASITVQGEFETFYGDTIINLYPYATSACNILCHTGTNRRNKNWYGDCLDYRISAPNKGGLGMTPDEAIAACDALDSDGDGWTNNEEVFGNHGLGYSTLPGNNFAVAQGLMPDGTTGESSSPPPTLSAIFNDIDYGVIPPYSLSQGNGGMEDQPSFVEWEIDVAGYGFAAPVASSGPINIYNPVYSVGNPADNTFIWTPPSLLDNTIYSWRVRFMDGNAAGDTHEWGDWAYASFSTDGTICTDNDGDTYAIEGGSCGLIDCDDNNPAVNPGATEVCGDGIDNNCDTQVDEGCDTTPPAIPTGLVAIGGDSQVDLSWDANTEPDLHHYLIYRATTSGGPYNMIAMRNHTHGTAYTDNAVVNGTTYYYVITADDMSGNESAMSNEASATPTGPVCTDADGDTYAVEGGGCGEVDCDDTDPAVNPGAAEVCGDGIDNNCDTQIDEGCATCTDADGDGYYAEAGCGTEVDCDDGNPDINPGACDIKRNGIDEDCDGTDRRSGPACPSGDPEICDDGIDNDGDGDVDCADADCSGDPACSGGCDPSPEICDDGVDNDCDGKVDCADKKDCKNFPGC